MAILGPVMKDLTMKNQYVQCKVRFSRFNGRFKQAQTWLDKMFIQKMQPVVPYKTGEFLGKINAQNAGNIGTGRIVTSVPPQGRYLYPGYHYKTGKPFRWTNPLTQPKWGTYTYTTYRTQFKNGVRHIIVTGNEPNE